MKKFLIIFPILLIILYVFISNTIGQDPKINLRWIKDLVPNNYKKIVRDYAFPYQANQNSKLEIKKLKERHELNIEYYQEEIKRLKISEKKLILKVDNDIRDSLVDLFYEKKSKKKIAKNLDLQIFTLEKKFLRGIKLDQPGSAYIDFYKNKIFIMSTTGIFAFHELGDKELLFKQIKNNIDDFLTTEQLLKTKEIGIKDIKIFNETLFLSYTNEITKNCWNITVLKAKLNLKEIIFEKLFEPKDCINEFDPEFNDTNDEITFSQTGGRIIPFKKDTILLSTGDFRLRSSPQNIKSSMGKILKINIINGKYEIISMGHRNPQGLYFNNNKNYILESEHGPHGGDEINLIEVDKEEVQNFGWAQASYGEHYCGGKTGCLKHAYIKYPLLKSHIENRYAEPLKSFTPAVGPSEIINLDKNIYALGTMKKKSLIIFEINKKNKIDKIRKVVLGERIRDITVNKISREIYLFLENTNSIGLINIDSLLKWYEQSN